MSHVRVGRPLLLPLFLLSVAAFARADSPTPPALSVPAYVAWLDRLISTIDPPAEDPARWAALLEDTPAAWRVEASGRAFDVSNAWLLRDLRALRARPDRPARDRLLDRLCTLRSVADSFQEPSPDASAPRALLNGILNRREFQDIHGPTWLDRLEQRLLQMLFKLVERLFGSSAIPTVSSVLVYALIALAVIVLAAWTVRFITRSAAAESVVLDRPVASQKASSVWLSEAHAAAARGNWREAVRLAYWCAVSFLEDRGAWRPDRARTPREYLRLLPPASEDRPALTALTRTFELVWYGAEEADARRFAEALAHLEKIGCRPA